MKNKFMAVMLPLFAISNASAQKMEATNSTIDCGQIVYNKPITVEFEVRNKGNKALRIQSVRKSCGCTEIDYPQSNISAGTLFKVRTTYDAAQMGHFEKQVELYGEGGKESLMLTLKGIVVEEVSDYSGNYPFKLGDIQAEKNNIEFDDVNRGDRPSQKIHIMNTSSKAIQPTVMHLPNYLKADISPSTIAPGKGGVITLTLDSRELRDFGLTQTSVYLGMFPGDKVSPKKELTISAVLLPGFENMTPEEKLLAPKMLVMPTTLEYDTAFDGRRNKKEEIDITNYGVSTLEIQSLQMFTSGLNLSLSNTRIGPGEVGKLKVSVNEKQLKGARSTPRILMITNDPEQPKVIITIKIK
ncbi:DUF1573 domain-containing protein [Hoylesella saccharolytica]|jgi:hypothetical protein|uniref:DUF1573 domain-containing protein n=1 Tax=Hoylesella saccharolytica TaxID=633701 RepID=UPI0028E483DD|nr:DUF1573 domain-containing protein [Hoylesella saccharolytica]